MLHEMAEEEGIDLQELDAKNLDYLRVDDLK